MKKDEAVVLNIDETKEIDKNGLTAIKSLLSLALIKEKKLSITGSGCKEIYDDFNKSKIA